MDRNKIIITIALVSILISVSTWAVDFFALVEECIYCRTERTIIGLLGILMLIPLMKYIKSYISFVLGFFGAHVTSDQIFNHVHNLTFDMMLLLAWCALFIIIGQVWLIHYFDWISPDHDRLKK